MMFEFHRARGILEYYRKQKGETYEVGSEIGGLQITYACFVCSVGLALCMQQYARHGDPVFRTMHRIIWE